jgi:hypothetical protein
LYHFEGPIPGTKGINLLSLEAVRYHFRKFNQFILYAMTINWKEVGLHFKGNIEITDRLVSYWDKRLDNLPNNPVELDLYGKAKNNDV